jgi:DNA-binding beta-propeller fold protein YncE
VISERTATVTATVTVGSNPTGDAVDTTTGAAYVDNASSDTVSVLTVAGGSPGDR